MTNRLRKIQHPPSGASRRMQPKGWTRERRARQAALIRRWQPWRYSTGPRTELGKARCAMNGTSHGVLSDAHMLKVRRARQVLRLAARNLALYRALACPPNPGLRSGGRRMRASTLDREGSCLRDVRMIASEPPPLSLRRDRPPSFSERNFHGTVHMRLLRPCGLVATC